ncbi:MAG: methionyl-tRNA formyltransferase [Candidatus Gastranaerophilales bacterium]|nr:methionyl-tRNA formyltransferase [Candidatus Gastranaerophilales bacterium]
MFGFNNKKRILIIGMPDLVLYCLIALKKANKNIVGVITSPPNNPTYEYMKDFLKKNNLLHIENNKNFKDENLLQTVRDLKPDVAFVCSFNYLLPKELYEIPPLGTINFHPSLLPDYRGANPYFHVIMNEEKETGITMHYLDETFDTGDIIKQIKVPIEERDTMGSLFNRLNQTTAKLCVDTVNFLEQDGILPRIPQIQTDNYKEAPKIYAGTDDVKINWNNNIKDIEKFIRALNPFFGAVSKFNGKELKFWDVEMIYNQEAENLPSGTVCDITNEYMIINAKDGFIKTKILGIDDTNYFSDTKDVIAYLNIKKGDKLN